MNQNAANGKRDQINSPQHMIRNILSVLAGYVIFVILTIIYGAAFSSVSGFITQLIAKTKNITLNYVLCFIMAGFATFSLFKTTGNHWTQLLAIFLFAPISILGGLFYIKRNNK